MLRTLRLYIFTMKCNKARIIITNNFKSSERCFIEILADIFIYPNV